MYGFKLIPSNFNFFSDEKFLETECFRHAISTPVTILLSALDNDGHRIATSKRYRHALLTLKELSQSFHQSQSKVCFLGKVLKEIKILLQDENTAIHVINASKKRSTLYSVNASRFQEALICLIKNSLEAKSKAVIITYTDSDKSVSITIRDFGKGISWWQRMVIGLPFVSFKKNGTGLGLFFAKNVIVNELKGSFSLISSVGSGTTIMCTIPTRR